VVTYPLTKVDFPTQWTSGSLREPGRHTALRLSRLKALVMLSGVIRAKSWLCDIGRSALDLPIDGTRTVLSQWLEQAARLADVPGVGRFAVKVLVDRASPMPESQRLRAAVRDSASVDLHVERDPADFRGTGGVLRDLAQRYHDDDYLLVATGAQILVRPLAEVVTVLAGRCADVAVGRHEDRTPAGVVWVRCGCLRAIPDVGFIDLKEQALPQIARKHRVEVVTLPPVGTPHRTAGEYLRAVRDFHLRRREDAGAGNPFAENWCPTFSVVEEGATVHPSAEIHDSVVLKGARVGPNAVVVRSLVGPGQVVRRGQRLVDQFVKDTRQGRA
jgi:hypothetical protein